MKTTFIKENILCPLSRIEIEYLNYLVRIYDDTYSEKYKYMFQIIKENNYFYKLNEETYRVLKIK